MDYSLTILSLTYLIFGFYIGLLSGYLCVRLLDRFVYYVSKKVVLVPEPVKMDVYRNLQKSFRIISEKIETPDGEVLDAQLYNIYKIPRYNDDYIFLYSHGYKGNLSTILESFKSEFYCKFGSVFMYDYRGYGFSTGEPSDKGMFIDIRSAWNFLVYEKKVNPNRIIVIGLSLGTSVSSHLIYELVNEDNELVPKTTILQNSFCTIWDIVNDVVPYFGKFINLDFDTKKFIESIYEKYNRKNILNIIIIHSVDDVKINHYHSDKLVDGIDLQKDNKVDLRLFKTTGPHNCPFYNQDIMNHLLSIIKQ